MDVIIQGGTDGEGGGEGPLVVLMHGFGAPGDDLVGLADGIAAPAGTRFAFPAAPIDLGPMFAGGRAWWHLDLEERMRRQALGIRDINEVPEDLHDVSQLVEELLTELEGTLKPPHGKLVLGGFSQGAMLALDVALRGTRPLAGLVLLSGTHIAANEWAPLYAQRKGLQVFQSHGHEDPVLPFAVSDALRSTMEHAGIPVEWVPFRGGHGIPPLVLSRLGAFLTRALA